MQSADFDTHLFAPRKQHMDIFIDFLNDANIKRGFFPIVNPDGVSLIGIESLGNNVLLTNITTNDFNLKKYNDNIWENRTDKLKKKTLEMATILVIMEVSSYCLRENIEHDISSLVFNNKDKKGTLYPCLIPPQDFAKNINHANKYIDSKVKNRKEYM